MKIIVVLFFAFLLYGCLGTYTESANGANQLNAANNSEVVNPQNLTETNEPGAGVKEFRLIAKQWEFVPNVINVSLGDEVKLKIASEDVEHGFALPDFNINVRLEPRQEIEVNFIADKSGEFEFYCSVYCGEGHSEMRGTLIVNE